MDWALVNQAAKGLQQMPTGFVIQFGGKAPDSSNSFKSPDAQTRPWEAGSISPLASPQKQLLDELLEASKYLQQLNLRLDADRKAPSDG